MFPKNYIKKSLSTRLILFIITTVFFIAGFVINITSNQAFYNLNLNVVPNWQKNSIIGSDGFIVFMNIVSNIFNPVICAGYVLLFFLISYRKLQILVFLIWFIFLSWILSIFKEIFHQARPYWIQGSNIQMLQWTCYTQYGMPSGHSMLGIVLLQFVIRFFSRVCKCVSNNIGIFYFLIIILQGLVMFSRVILGMHSFNQVLFGLMIGLYSMVLYYFFIEKLILKWLLKIFKMQKEPTQLILLVSISILSLSISVLITLLLRYNNSQYQTVILDTKGCQKTKLYKSFQYKCLEDSALFMAISGMLLAFNLLKNPANLAKQLNYSRLSCRFLAKLCITLIVPLVVLAIFVNPLWDKINVGTEDQSLIIWGCQVVGFFLGTFILLYVTPQINQKAGLEQFIMPNSYTDFKKFQVINMVQEANFIIARGDPRRETQLTETNKQLTNNLNESLVKE